MKYIGWLVLLFAGAAFSAETKISLSWDVPTEREDGTALPIEEIKGYRLYGKNETGTFVKIADLTADSLQTVQTGKVGFEYCYKISTVDTDDLEGQLSDTVCVNIPAPPKKVTLTIELI